MEKISGKVVVTVGGKKHEYSFDAGESFRDLHEASKTGRNPARVIWELSQLASEMRSHLDRGVSAHRMITGVF